MIWLSEWWTFAAALLVVFAPGAVAAVMIGLRGFTAAAAAAPLSLAAIGAASIVGIAIPFRWGALAWGVTAVALVLAAVAVAIIVRRVNGAHWRETAPPRSWATWLPFAAVAIAVALLVPRLISVFGDPQNISQTFDNIYHLNAVRYILDSGALAPTRQLIEGFYPSLWHALTATVVAVSGATIPAAVNVVSVVLGAVVWPLSVVFLVRQIVGASTPALLAAGALSAGLGAFPLLMLDFGVLYPNVLSIALLPAALAALVSVTGVGEPDRPPALLRWILLFAWIATLALAHPSTFMAFLAIGFWPAVAGFRRWHLAARQAGAPRRRVAWGIGLWTASVVVGLALLLVARPTPQQAFWGPSGTAWQAITHVVMNGLVYRPFNIAASVLMIAGIVAILGWQRRRWWLVAGWVTLSGIYIVCLSFPVGFFRYGITGTWYSDLFRIGALFPAVVVPLGAIGFAALVGIIAGLAARRSDAAARAATAVVCSVGVVAVVLLTQLGAPMASATVGARAMYVMSPTSPLLTTYERDLLLRLPEHVASDELIVGSPWTGTSLSYALADRRTLIAHIYADLAAELPPDTALIVDRLNQASSDPAVCEAVDRTNTRWVLDFGADEIHNDDHPYPGLADLEASGAAELVDSEGPDARLYRITACD